MPVAESGMLERFEQAVYAADSPHYNEAVSCLHQILANLETSGGDVQSTARTHYYPRLACAISALLLLRKSRRVVVSFVCSLIASSLLLTAAFPHKLRPFQEMHNTLWAD